MEKTIHFISGLPRSGSTLLSNLLAQHPDCHTTSTSACHEVLFVIRNNWHNWLEHKSVLGSSVLGSNAFDFDGKIAECVVFASDQSANRSAIDSNIMTHYGIT